MSDRNDPKGLFPRVLQPQDSVTARLGPRRKRWIVDSNQRASSILLCLLAIASSDPPQDIQVQDIQVKAKYRGPEPLRAGVLDLCELW